MHRTRGWRIRPSRLEIVDSAMEHSLDSWSGTAEADCIAGRHDRGSGLLIQVSNRGKTHRDFQNESAGAKEATFTHGRHMEEVA